VKELSKEKNKIVIKNEFDVRSYFLIRQQLEDLATQYHSFIRNPKNLVPFCNPGRLIKVSKIYFRIFRLHVLSSSIVLTFKILPSNIFVSKFLYLVLFHYSIFLALHF